MGMGTPFFQHKPVNFIVVFYFEMFFKVCCVKGVFFIFGKHMNELVFFMKSKGVVGSSDKHHVWNWITLHIGRNVLIALKPFVGMQFCSKKENIIRLKSLIPNN